MYQDSVYEGYLTKSPPKMNRRWQRRYFVLLPNKQLLYFSKLGGSLKGTIDLSLLQEVLYDLYLDKGPSNVMSLDVKGTPELNPKTRGCQDRIFYLLADSREDMETWHGHIMEVADLQLCRKKNVVADSPQGEEYYISARRKTAIRKEEEQSDRRGLAQSLATDPGMSAEFGTYQTSAELSQSMQDSNFGVYDVNHAKMLTDITISQGDDSSSEDESFVCPSSPEKVRRPKSPLAKRGMSLRGTDHDNRQTQPSYSSVLRSHHSLPLLIDEETQETCPPVPAHREDLYPQSVDLSPPLPPQRDSSLSKLALYSESPCQDEQRGVTRERKARTTRFPCKSMFQDSPPIGGSQKRPAAKLPAIPLGVLLTQVKEVPTQTPIPRPRRPSSSSASSSSLPLDLATDPTSPTAITPYKTVQRTSDLYPDEPPDTPDPSYVNVDTSHGIYVKFDPGPSEPGEGTYVSISRDPIPLEKLAMGTDTSGYTKIVEPKPRGRLAIPDGNKISSEANCK